MRVYELFWQKALGVKVDSLNSGFTRSSTGKYLERHQRKYVFFYTDLKSYARVLAGHPARLERLGNQSPERSLKLTFNDLDYGLLNSSSFKPSAPPTGEVKIQRLTKKHKKEIAGFRKKCSRKDWDTLDLALADDYALGLFKQRELLGIARFAKMPSVPKLVDITVVLARKARGRGYSTVLVSNLLETVLRKKLVPKYRVAEKNAASRAIAERLGLVPLFSLKTFR